MGLAPFLYAAHIFRPTEVVAVLGFFEPTLLTCRFGGLAAFGFFTIFLSPPVPMVGREENTAVRALALSDLFSH